MEKPEDNIYRSLAQMVLPNDILTYFEVVNFEEEITGGTILNCWPEKILHIYLDEKDTAHSADEGYRTNGFTEATQVSDFPIRDRKAVLHVRRRRWITPDGHNEVVDYGELLGACGTKLSREMAAFFKADPR